MKIKNFEINSSVVNASVELCPDRPVCFVGGNFSEEFLDGIRKLTGERDVVLADPAALYGDVEIDGKDYGVCCICQNEDGLDRLAVNFKPGSREYSMTDTLEYEMKCAKRHVDHANVLSVDRISGNERSALLIGLAKFVETVKRSTEKGDDRPLFIYNFFDRLDESVDVVPLIDMLGDLGRRVFVSVCDEYPCVKNRGRTAFSSIPFL